MSRAIPHAASLAGLLCLVALASAGCDDARFREGTRTAKPPVFQTQTMRTRVSEAGLQRLFRVVYPDGVLLDHDGVPKGELDARLGPVSEQVAVEQWKVDARSDELEVELTARQLSMTVPVRVEERVGMRICSHVVEADQVRVVALASLAGGDDGPSLSVTQPPTVELSNPRVSRLGECPPLDEIDMQSPSAVDDAIIGYLEEAWAVSARQAVELTPLAGFGLVVDTEAAVERLSAFANRRGQLLVASRVSPQADPGLSDDGLSVDLDLSLHAQRASCAPATTASPPADGPAGPVPAAELDQIGAEVGITLGTSLLARLAQTSMLAGFGCRGLETGLIERSDNRLSTDDLLLEDVGLDQLPVGAWAEPVLAPTQLPRVETSAATGNIELIWDGLLVDLYADIHDVPVRLLRLDSNITLTLRPRESAERIDLVVESVYVAEASLQSKWVHEQPFDTDLLRWSRRVLLLVLEDAISLPLPLEAGTPLELVASQVRADDLLLLLEVDRRL